MSTRTELSWETLEKNEKSKQALPEHIVHTYFSSSFQVLRWRYIGMEAGQKIKSGVTFTDGNWLTKCIRGKELNRWAQSSKGSIFSKKLAAQKNRSTFRKRTKKKPHPDFTGMVLTVRSCRFTTSSHPARLLTTAFVSDRASKCGGNARTIMPWCGRTMVLLSSPSFLNFLSNLSGRANR